MTVGTSFTLTKDGAIRSLVTHEGAVPVTTEADLLRVMEQLANVVPTDTGLLPPGVMSVRSGADFTQVVVEMPPDVYTTCWGHEEGGGHAIYQLAMPWRYCVGVFCADQLIGARMFYSPQRVTHLQQPLYHANVPNLNCRGYSTTGVGWLCLYHAGVSCPTAGDKARYLIDRCSGGEPFNDGNMHSTDGPRFYASMYQEVKGLKEDRSFLWDPNLWQAKTTEEGVGWTLDPTLWIPVLVEGIDAQDKHVPGGEQLTLGMVMHGAGKFYYSDEHMPKLFNVISRDLDVTEAWGGGSVPPSTSMWGALEGQFTKATGPSKRQPLELSSFELPVENVFAKIVPKPAKYKPINHEGLIDGEGGPDIECISCCELFYEDDIHYTDNGYICDGCAVWCGCDSAWLPSQMKGLDPEHVAVLGFSSSRSYCPSCHADYTDEAVALLAQEAQRLAEEDGEAETSKKATKAVKKAAPKKKLAEATSA